MLFSTKKPPSKTEPVRSKPEAFKILADQFSELIGSYFSTEQLNWLMSQGVIDRQLNLRFQRRAVMAGSAEEAADIIKQDFLYEKFMLVMLDGLPGSGKGYLGASIKKMSGYEEGLPDKNFEGDSFLYTQVLAEPPEQLCRLLDMVGVPSRFENGVPYALDILQKKVFENRNQIFPQNKATFLRYYINYPVFKKFVAASIKSFYKDGKTSVTHSVPQYVRSEKGNYLGNAPQHVDLGVYPQKIVTVDGVGTVNAFREFWPEQTVNVVNFMPILENLTNVVARDGQQKERPEFRLQELTHLFTNFWTALSQADIIHYDQNFQQSIITEAQVPAHPMQRALAILKIALSEITDLKKTIVDRRKSAVVAAVNNAVKQVA